MGDRKMNLVEQISDAGVDKDGKLYGRPQEGRMVMFTDGPLYAINPVPVLLHLTAQAARGNEALFKVFPIT
jgi:hypothetical protein